MPDDIRLHGRFELPSLPDAAAVSPESINGAELTINGLIHFGQVISASVDGHAAAFEATLDVEVLPGMSVSASPGRVDRFCTLDLHIPEIGQREHRPRYLLFMGPGGTPSGGWQDLVADSQAANDLLDAARHRAGELCSSVRPGSGYWWHVVDTIENAIVHAGKGTLGEV